MAMELGQTSLGPLIMFPTGTRSPIAKTKLQPIVDLSLDDGWRVGTSEMNFNYSWSRSAFSNIPLGIQLGKSFKIGDEDVKLTTQVEYNFASISGTSG